jgi:hypothetical protein
MSATRNPQAQFPAWKFGQEAETIGTLHFYGAVLPGPGLVLDPESAKLLGITTVHVLHQNGQGKVLCRDVHTGLLAWCFPDFLLEIGGAK